MIELARLVEDFAAAIQRADSRSPQAIGSRTGRAYQLGIGPHTDSRTIRLVAEELIAVDEQYARHTLDVPYPGQSRQRCDWCLGSPPSWQWAIEAKMLRLFGDNGKLNDNMLMHVLSPYPRAPQRADRLRQAGHIRAARPQGHHDLRLRLPGLGHGPGDRSIRNAGLGTRCPR